MSKCITRLNVYLGNNILKIFEQVGIFENGSIVSASRMSNANVEKSANKKVIKIAFLNNFGTKFV